MDIGIFGRCTKLENGNPLFFQIARIFYYFSDRPEHFERRYGDCTLLSLESNRTPKCQRCRTTTVRNSLTESGEAFVEDMMAGIPVEEHTSATPEGENGHSFLNLFDRKFLPNIMESPPIPSLS